MTGTFSLGEEHNDFRAAVADFAARDLAPHVERWNAAHEAPLEAIKLMGDLGLFGLGGPEEYGGAGDFTSLCIAIEEIGKVDQSLGITLEAAVGLGVNPIAHFGTAAQQARWLPDLLAGALWPPSDSPNQKPDRTPVPPGRAPHCVIMNG